ncbi:TonB family protein [Pantoea sp. Mb-10]|uniref:TonB family protein n=1 Tax=unclassified Pantoea TaxID=2630326 RepID=UPI001E2BD56C|nr:MULTISPECIES: TonB family protein [unclassified Pantoea]MCE0491004.1 TonB family protein [Pantoea sp. Mb-10]MCE0499837.1 TonB family protein [Pantoea sp. Pb-8]
MIKCAALLLALYSTFSTAQNLIRYPERAEKLRIDGAVNLIYDIEYDGTVSNIRVLSAEPKYIFDRSVIKQVSQWKFKTGNKREDVSLNVIFNAN